MRIICDMDEVIVDMMNPLLKRYNERFGSDITIEDITQWELPQDMKCIYKQEYFFFQLPPIVGATEGVRQLMEWGHDIIIATNHSADGFIAGEKADWINEFLPELEGNMMIGARKDLLQGDVIIDDNADYLINSPCPIKICMDRPWNRELISNAVECGRYEYVGGRIAHDFYRVSDWQQILDLFAGGACKIW